MESNSAGRDKTSIRILLAEDNEINYRLVKAILKEFTLVRVINGAEAVNMVKEFFFDLVLMDIRIPVMDGLEATAKIREFNKNIPIIALTANAFDSDRTSAFDAGCNDFLAKPFQKEDLLHLLKNKVGVKF